MSKKVLFYPIKIIMAGVVALALLSAFTYIYGYSGVHVVNNSGATDYKWEAGQLRTTMEEGLVWLKMDENGFNNAYETSESIDILLMGSSHMEASNVAANENVGYLLNVLLTDYYTYNIGISGHEIYNCVDNVEDALSEYTPSSYVVLETSTVELDLENMEQVISGTYPHIKSYDSGMLYWLQKNIPAVKSIYNKLSNWMDADSESEESPDTVEMAEEYKEILCEFLSQYANSALNVGVTPIIFYQPSTQIDSDGNYIDSTNSDYLTVFAETCDEVGIVFVDMTEDFQTLYEEKSILAHGFINTAVGSGHLNAAGHEVIAQKLATVIKEVEQDVTQ